VHIVVVGCGRVGSELAGLLEKAGHTVAVVDKRREAFRRLPKGFGGATVVGFGFDRDVLIEAGITDAGAFAAVTSGDNSNIMSARVARETFGIERVVARIYDPRRAVIYQRLGIPTVATVSWTTDQVMRRLLPDERPAEWVDPTSEVCLVERDLPAAWAGRKLADLGEPERFKVVAITRMGTARIPTGELVGQEGDILYFLVATEDLPALDERLGDEGTDTGAHH
jgi:trk system potassium uptake protein TrkA